MNKSCFEQVIAEKGELIYTHVGDSMAPFLQKRDLLVIRKAKLPLKRLDIPLYRRDNGQYVLHRIVKVRGQEYVLCGDNRTALEYGITDRHIVGVLTAIIRDGETIPVNSRENLSYARRRCAFLPLRRAGNRFGAVLKRFQSRKMT